MNIPKKDTGEINDNPKADPSTHESIEQGKTITKIQKDLDPAPKEKKEEDASKDAEEWRNEG